MEKFVRIQSSITIMVTAGLHNEDVTNPDAHVADRLKVNPTWPKLTCLIRKGAGWYPSEIVDWPTTKSLAADKVLTIGEYSDKPDGNIDELEKAKATIELATKEVVKDVKKSKRVKQIEDISLADVIKED